MLSLLIKKQMTELFQGFFYDKKTKTVRSASSSIISTLVYMVLVVVVIGGMIVSIATPICEPLVKADHAWLYFIVMGVMALAIGVFASVFTTYSSLFLAKDNDLLLSMPIPVRYIVASKLIGVYLIGAIYSLIVLIPAEIVYFAAAGVCFSAVIGGIVFSFSVTLLVFALSCLLGWIVARLSVRFKKNGYVSTVASLAFIALYYVCYFQATELIGSVVNNIATVGGELVSNAYVLYMIGSSATGNMLNSALLVLAASALAFGACFLLTKSFAKIAMSSRGMSSTKHGSDKIKSKSVFSALLGREFGRFTSSSTYMLNCAMGVLFICAAVVVLIINAGMFVPGAREGILADETFIATAFCTCACALCGMIDTAAASVSLEGNTLWLIRSMPVDEKYILLAKAGVQYLLTAVPMLVLSVTAVCIALPGVIGSVTMIILPQLFALFNSFADVYINLCHPSFDWSSEVYPIKQSMCILIAMFLPMLFAIEIIGGYMLLGALISEIYLLIEIAFFAAAAYIMYKQLTVKGAEIFRSL